jgi:hypothetical protein
MTTSASGSTLTGPNGTGSLTDATGAVFTLVGGQCVLNGALQAGTSSVVLMLIFNGVVYQQAAAHAGLPNGGWFAWISGAWAPETSNPLPVPVPPVAAPPTSVVNLAPGQSVQVNFSGSASITIQA